MATPHLGVPPPFNEPPKTYAPGSAERHALQGALRDLGQSCCDLPLRLGGRPRTCPQPQPVRVPHRHAQVVGMAHMGDHGDVEAAIAAAMAARHDWCRMPFVARAAIFLRAADLLCGPYRATINAATMLGQSKTVQQAEIDAACELADFWRFNVHFAAGLYGQQPLSPPGAFNQMDYRPLDGFVLAVAPFNFTAIAGNLATAPALMGNVVVFKPAPTAALAAQVLLDVLDAAGLPPGVINLVNGRGSTVGDVALRHPDFAGLHFTGSTATFRRMWSTVAEGLGQLRALPRLVGETGGKDFVVAHASADVAPLAVALVRGAFEYQGQKCSAASRAYVPASLWGPLLTRLRAEVDALKVGPVEDFSTFMGAVIDAASHARLAAAIAQAAAGPGSRVLVGGHCDDRVGYFVGPTVVEVDSLRHPLLRDELFGPLLALVRYDDADFPAVLRACDEASPLALTGAIFARDRAAIGAASEALRFTAGNFYINDKPTGAVVGQQPFGGGRASGTNDKAGSVLNLLRWVSPRCIKETFVPPEQVAYPSMRP